MLYNSDLTVSSGSYHKAIHGIYLRAIFSTTSQPSRYLYNLLPLTDLKCGVINFNKKKNNDQWPYLQEQQKCLIQNGRQETVYSYDHTIIILCLTKHTLLSSGFCFVMTTPSILTHYLFVRTSYIQKKSCDGAAHFLPNHTFILLGYKVYI